MLYHGSYATDLEPDSRGGYQPNTTATYNCHNNFRIQGDDVRVCQENGTWTGDMPTCKGVPLL